MTYIILFIAVLCVIIGTILRYVDWVEVLTRSRRDKENWWWYNWYWWRTKGHHYFKSCGRCTKPTLRRPLCKSCERLGEQYSRMQANDSKTNQIAKR